MTYTIQKRRCHVVRGNRHLARAPEVRHGPWETHEQLDDVDVALERAGDLNKLARAGDIDFDFRVVDASGDEL